MNLLACRGTLADFPTISSCSQKTLRTMLRNHRLLQLSALFQCPTETSSIGSTRVRYYSNPARRPNFFSQFIENIKQDLQKNKEMKESLKKFREEAEKLEQSDALRSARQKFHSVESEASKSREVIKEQLDNLRGKVHEVIEEASKSELGKKAGQLGEEITKSAKDAAESISEKSQTIGKSSAFQALSQTAQVVKKELDHHGIEGKVYVAPKKLRKRKEISEEAADDKQVEVNTEATGIELHKDSKFYESWQNFKDKNPYVNKVLDWKIKYDESDNPLIRASRMFTDTVTGIVGGLFQKTELSEVLTEICKLDPNFDKTRFLRDCETDFIPNILEAMVRGDLDILQDWCYEVPFKVLSQPIKETRKMGYVFDGKVLDIDNVDLVMGKVMEHGPVLVISFQAQQSVCIRDASGKVVNGDPDKVLRVHHVWALCRDLTELNSKAAWRLLESSHSVTEQLV